MSLSTSINEACEPVTVETSCKIEKKLYHIKYRAILTLSMEAKAFIYPFATDLKFTHFKTFSYLQIPNSLF